MHIIITIPHYTCIELSSGHSCDLYSKILADSIAEEIKKYYQFSIFPGDINRRFIDLNRKESRNTTFRNNIREEVIKILQRGERITLLDCHSYDIATYFSNKLQFTDPDFVILSDDKRFDNEMIRLRNLLLKSKIKVNLLRGINNDIIDEFSEYPYSSYFQNDKPMIIPVLLEVFEGISLDRLQIISSNIRYWISSL